MYQLHFYKKTITDKRYLKAAGLFAKVVEICQVLSLDPKPLRSKPLSRDLKGKRSIRINLQHRLVYEIFEKEKIVKILSMWGHYK